MQKVKGYVVQELMNEKNYQRGFELLNEAKANCETDDERAVIDKYIAKIENDGTKPGEWFIQWKRIRYDEAKTELEKLRRHMPDRKFRVMPAILHLDEKKLVKDVDVLEWANK